MKLINRFFEETPFIHNFVAFLTDTVYCIVTSVISSVIMYVKNIIGSISQCFSRYIQMLFKLIKKKKKDCCLSIQN